MNLTQLVNADQQTGMEDKLRRLVAELNTANPPSAAEVATTLTSYLTTAAAATTYLTSATATSTYLTQANAATTYRALDVIQRAVPETGATVVASSTTNILLLVPADTLATLTVTFPATPTDKQRFRMATTEILTSLTLDGGTIVGAPTTLALGGGAEWIYSSTDSAWIRLQ